MERSGCSVSRKESRWIMRYLGKLLPQLASMQVDEGIIPSCDRLTAVLHASNLSLALTASSSSFHPPFATPHWPAFLLSPHKEQDQKHEEGLCLRKIQKKRKTMPPLLPSSPPSLSEMCHPLLGSKRVRICRRRRSRRRSRLQTLRSLIPGGRELDDVVTLMDEASDYIQCLQMQVQALQILTRAIEETPPNL